MACIGAMSSVGCRAKAPPSAVVIAPKPAPKPATKPATVDAWISAKDFCTLPLAEQHVPATAGQLSESLLSAWKLGMAIKNPAQAVTILGGRYPAVDTLRVDLSEAVIKPGGSRVTLKDATGGTRSLAVGTFAFVAEPMVAHKAPLNVLVTGDDVCFSLRTEKSGKSFLVLTDARSATLHFDAAVADLERLMLAMAREQAAKRGLVVRKVELNLRTRSPKSIDVELYCHTFVGLLPAGLKFTAHVDVDDQMNARLSNLTVDGDDLLGPLVTHFLRPAMKKHEGKTKPLVSFPGGMTLKDVQIRGGQRITLDAVFSK
jgi:hypothetical protein